MTIRASVHDVQFTLMLAVCLVVMVIFLFLRNVWATIIPSATVPVALICTFGVMYLLNYSLDNLSLMALTLAVGFVIDDAIVMLENIFRHVEEGMKPMEAAIKGAGEIGFTIVSISFSLVAVFIPLLFMGGIVGRLFREFAVTVTAAVLVSAFVCLTLTPMMCSRFLRHDTRRHGLGLPGHRGHVHRADRGLSAHAGYRPASPLHHAAGVPGHRQSQRLPLHRDPQGVLPAAGQRHRPRHHRGRTGHLLQGDDERAAAPGRHRGAGSRHRRLCLLDGRRVRRRSRTTSGGCSSR